MTPQQTVPAQAPNLSLVQKYWCMLPSGPGPQGLIVVGTGQTQAELDMGCGKWASPFSAWPLIFILILVYSSVASTYLTWRDNWRDEWGFLVLAVAAGLAYPVGLPLGVAACGALVSWALVRGGRAAYSKRQARLELEDLRRRIRETELAPYLAAVEQDLREKA